MAAPKNARHGLQIARELRPPVDDVMNGCVSYLVSIALVTSLFSCSSPLILMGGDSQQQQGVAGVNARDAVAEAKSIPAINWHNIRPPYDWWTFFKDADRHPFRYQATGFDMLNAWWLIEASTLAYSNPAFAERTFARAGLPVVRFFNGQSTQVFVASNDNFILVAFRGMETSVRNEKPDYLDVLYDLLTVKRILLVPYDGGSVHRGFKLALDEVWWDRKQDGRSVKGLKSYLDELSVQKERPMWFTGHSLGGALATLAADRYSKVRDFTLSAHLASGISNSKIITARRTSVLLTMTTLYQECLRKPFYTIMSVRRYSLMATDTSRLTRQNRILRKTLQKIL